MKRIGRIIIFLSFLGLVHCGQSLEAKKFSATTGSSNSVTNYTYNQNGSVQRQDNHSTDINLQVMGECDSSTLSCKVISRINQIRAQHSLSALMLNKTCELAAQSHAQDMALYQYLDHTGRNGSTPRQRVEQYGPTGYGVAENIAVGNDNVEVIVQSWMESPGHRANILDSELKYTGVGVAASKGNITGYGSDLYYVQCFLTN